jgi:dihydroorotate dehydrogenase (fumarate)
MTDLRTTYMGIELKNPIIIGSNNLVTDPANAVALEKAGAAAIVYKSLFEEQIQLESWELESQLEAYNERNAEMTKLFPDIAHAGPKEYLMNLKKVKQSVTIPVFGSLNCVNKDTWVEWAKEMEKTGVDGIELNFYHVASDMMTEESLIIAEQVQITKEVVKTVKIPVAVKISPFYTNPLNFIHQLDLAGVKAFVLFNSLFQPDIDIEEQRLVFKYLFSNPEDNRLPLRYTALLHGLVKGDISSSRGIFSGNDIVKMILAGAQVVQIVSAIYKNGFNVIPNMLDELTQWMNKHQFKTLDEFRGKMSKKNIKSPFAYRRAQYIDILMRSDNILQEHALH